MLVISQKEKNVTSKNENRELAAPGARPAGVTNSGFVKEGGSPKTSGKDTSYERQQDSRLNVSLDFIFT